MYPDGLERLLQQLGEHTDNAHDPVRLVGVKVQPSTLWLPSACPKHCHTASASKTACHELTGMLCSVYCRLQSKESFGVSASHSTYDPLATL